MTREVVMVFDDEPKPRRKRIAPNKAGIKPGMKVKCVLIGVPIMYVHAVTKGFALVYHFNDGMFVKTRLPLGMLVPLKEKL